MSSLIGGIRNAILASSGISLSVYSYLNFMGSEIQIDCKMTETNQKIISRSPQLVSKEYRSTFYLPFRCMEIIYGNTMDYRNQIFLRRDIVYSYDGENLALDWMIDEADELSFRNFFEMKSSAENLRFRNEKEVGKFDFSQNKNNISKIKSGNLENEKSSFQDRKKMNQLKNTFPNSDFVRKKGNFDFLKTQTPKNRPIVLILPGLSGGSHSNYVQNLAKSLALKGFRPAIFNVRGINIKQITENIFDYRYMKKDLDSVVKFIKKSNPESNLYIAGFSLGSSIGTSYVAENPGVVKAMACVANPFDVYKAGVALNSLWNRVYS